MCFFVLLARAGREETRRSAIFDPQSIFTPRSFTTTNLIRFPFSRLLCAVLSLAGVEIAELSNRSSSHASHQRYLYLPIALLLRY